MRHSYRVSWIGVTSVIFISATAALTTESNPTFPQPNQVITARPIPFTRNMGQWPDSILFRADIGEAVMWIVRDGIYYQYVRRIPRAITPDEQSLPDAAHSLAADKWKRDRDSIETTMIKAQFVGANSDAEVIGLEEMDYKSNYFIGNDPARWRTDVPNYSGVTLKGLYPDLTFSCRGSNGLLTIEVNSAGVHGADQVEIEYVGTERVQHWDNGSCLVRTEFGDMPFTGIVPEQVGRLVPAAATATAQPTGTTTLVYSTYLGGGGIDYGYGIALDGSGCTYITGYTWSANFPTLNPYQTDLGLADVFVSKLSAAGNSLVYSTYLGGADDDFGWGITVDASGRAIVTGSTPSTNFPLVNAYQANQAGVDAFLTMLSAAGNSLIYSTYLGGNDSDEGFGVDTDANSNAYVTGHTLSTNFPTQSQFQTDQTGGDAFVTKLNSTGTALGYSTYIGGGDSDMGWAIAVDPLGAAYVTGFTSSTNFPLQGQFQTNRTGVDAFVTKLAATGNSLVYSTYLGGSSTDYGYGIAVDGSSCAYVTGETFSSDFPTQSPFQTDQMGSDAFVSKLSPAGNSLLYGTYVGGAESDCATGITVTTGGLAHIAGFTVSTNFPTFDPYQTKQPGNDAFVTRFSESGSPVYSTCLGGSSDDIGTAVVSDELGAAFLAGYSSSTDFPTHTPYQTDQGAEDCFVAKLLFTPSCCLPDSKLRGDISNGAGSTPAGDGVTDGSDLQTCVEYVFFNDPTTLIDCLDAQDVNNDATFDGGDLGILVDYIFFNDTSVIKRCDGSPF